MKTKLEIIKYLIDEIQEEIEYNRQYEVEVKRAKETCHKENAGGWWPRLMPSDFQRCPRKSVIKDNAKRIRRMLMEIANS